MSLVARFGLRARLGAAMLAMSLSAVPAGADVIYETNGPFGSAFGLIGFDVESDQSVAVRFTPDADYRLDRVSVWFMSNDFNRLDSSTGDADASHRRLHRRRQHSKR